MRERGVVSEIRDGYVVVSVDKKAECAGCGLCLFKEGTGKTEFYAPVYEGAKKGDEVIVNRSERGKFYGVLLAFFVPLLLIGVSVAINYLFIKKELWILILSVIFIGLWFLTLCFIDKKLKNSGAFRSEVTEVIKSSAEPETTNSN